MERLRSEGGNEGWDFDGDRMEWAEERERRRELGSRILEAMNRLKSETIGLGVSESGLDTEADGSELTEDEVVAIGPPEGVEEVESVPIEEENWAIDMLRSQWGVPDPDKSQGVLEFEQKVGWEEFKRNAEGARLAGQESDFARAEYNKVWQDDVEEKFGDIGWVLTERLKQYDKSKRFKFFDGRRNFYGDIGVGALETALSQDRYMQLLENVYSDEKEQPKQQESGAWQANPAMMHLSYDELDGDGRLVSGIDEARPGDEKSVTIVFNADLVWQPWLDPGAKYPMTPIIENLHRDVNALVAKDEETYEKLKKMKAAEGVPIFTKEEWLQGGEELVDKVQKEHAGRIEAYYKAERERREREAQEKLAWEEKAKKEVFDEVDMEAVKELTGSFAEKVDSKTLEAIYNEIQLDMEHGARMMVDYMGSILELKEKPEVIYRHRLESGARGECKRRSGGDLIRLSKVYANGYNCVRQMETLAHECWHSYQHMVSGVEEGTVRQDRGELYKYNLTNYLQPTDDYEGYYNQLIEVEARAFAGAVTDKMKDFLPDKEKLEEQVFTKVDKKAIRKAVDERLAKVDAKELLMAMGVKNVKELTQMKVGEILPKVLEYFGKAFGMAEPIETVMVDGEKKGFGDDAIFAYVMGDRIEVDQNKLERSIGEDQLSDLIYYVWSLDRKDFLKRELHNERGELYSYNFEHFVRPEVNADKYHKQLLVREGYAFTWEFMDDLEAESGSIPGKVWKFGKKAWSNLKKSLGREG